MLKHKELLRCLRYDPISGRFIWRVTLSVRGRAGNEAGCVLPERKRRKKEISITIHSQKYLASRLAWFYMTGKWPKNEIDHRDLNPLNNSWSNLRSATRAQNEANRGPRKTNRLGIKGVFPQNGKYGAQIHRNGHHEWLGLFGSVEAARNAYNRAAAKYDGEFLRV